MLKKSLLSLVLFSTVLISSTNVYADDLAKVAHFGKQLGGLFLNILKQEGYDTQLIEQGVATLTTQIESLSIVDIIYKKLTGKSLTVIESLYLKVALDKCLITAFLIVLFFALFQIGLMLLIFIFRRLL